MTVTTRLAQAALVLGIFVVGLGAGWTYEAILDESAVGVGIGAVLILCGLIAVLCGLAAAFFVGYEEVTEEEKEQWRWP